MQGDKIGALEQIFQFDLLDAELLGATAFELLVQRMAGGRPRRPTVLPAELIVRGSTGPPR